MTTKIHLTAVDEPAPGEATVIVLGTLPQFNGSDDDDLACGRCGEIIAHNVSTRTLHDTLVSEKHPNVLVKCLCGAHNVVPRPH